MGVVAVSNPFAAQVGADILARGGNAVDAAAAIQFALNVVEPQFCGIGGSCFLMIYLAKTGETIAVDSREKAPAAATPDMFQGLDYQTASTNGLAVGVPGTLLGMATALANYGTISLAASLTPAIQLAREGFPLNRFFAANTRDPRTTYQPETKAVFRLPDGRPLPPGYLLQQPDLAHTFELIKEHGPALFYEGEIARAIIQAQKRTRPGASPRLAGRMTLEDLAHYNVKIRQPVVGQYRGYTIKTMPPPSSGGITLLQMLTMLERFPLSSPSQGFGFGATKTLHVMIEAMRLAFADRARWLGDADFVPVPQVGLLAPAYLAKRGALIQVNHRLARVRPGNPLPYDTGGQQSQPDTFAPPEPPGGGHTTHFSVADQWGNVVSCTSTIEAVWGTGIMVPGYGFLLNNDLTDFNLTPQYDPARGNLGANDVAPLKRPKSSMTPTIVFLDGKPVAAYGSPGDTAIINTVLQITLNLFDHGMDLQPAIAAPRISVAAPDGFVRREAGFSATVLRQLQDMGHRLSAETSILGSVQAVAAGGPTGEFCGGADPRRQGTVIGVPGKNDKN